MQRSSRGSQRKDSDLVASALREAPPFEAGVPCCWRSSVMTIDSKLLAIETSASAEACCQACTLEWRVLRLVRANSAALSSFASATGAVVIIFVSLPIVWAALAADRPRSTSLVG
jgi:hypothetical protein